MRNKSWAWVLPALIVVLALFVAYFLDTGDGVSYSSSSTGERGASLLFDTLRHMNYPVRASYRPLTRHTNTDYVYIIIQPRTPPITLEPAKELLEWVENGGRLIFLCRRYSNTAIDEVLNTNGRNFGNFTLYRHGDGEVVTGSASIITNRILMENYSHGEAVQTTLERWNAERNIEGIYFAEYYHGFHTPQNFVGRLPLVIRLILAQMVLISIIMIWHLGKRFGNPIQYYEEVEREENEYVRALARLYMETDRKRRRKK